MKARVTFPITLTVDPAALAGDALDETIGQAADVVATGLSTARRELRNDAVRGEPRLGRVSFEWTGDRRRTFSEAERRAIERRLRRVVEDAMARIAALPPPAPDVDWHVDALELRARFRGLLPLAALVAPARAAELAVRHRDRLDDDVAAIAWVVTVLRPVRWRHLEAAFAHQATQHLGTDALFTYCWDPARVEELRGLDRRRLDRLPDLREQTPPSPDAATEWVVPADVTIVFLGAKLPELVVGEYLTLGAAVTVRLPWSLVVPMLTGVLDRVARRYALTDLPSFLAVYGDQPLTLRALPFVVKRAIAPAAAQQYVTDAARADDAHAVQLGDLLLLGGLAAASAPDDVLAPARALPGPTADVDPRRADWPPGVRGVLVYPLVDDRVMRARVAWAPRWQFGVDADALAVIALLGTRGFRDWAIAAKRHDEVGWDLVLLAIDRRGALDEFFANWLQHDIYVMTLRPLIALTVRSRYRRHPRLIAIIRQVEGWQQGVLMHDYEPEGGRLGHGLIRLFGSRDRGDWIVAAGDSARAADGVVAETTAYYSESGKVKRLKKATLERLSAPVQKKVGDLMARLVCAGDERLTEQEILAQATAEVLKEEGLDPGKDPDGVHFEPAEIRLSLRVIEVSRRNVGGVDETFVHFYQVRSVAGGAWEKAGNLEVKTALEFEAALQRYHLQHLTTALTIGALVIAVVGTGGFIVAAGIASWATVLIVIAISEAMYLWTNRHEGYSVTGFLLAAWIGELELLGFKGLGRALGLGGAALRNLTGAALTRILGELGAKSVTTAILRSSATRWIALLLRGAVAGVELGTLAAFHRLANALFEATHCKPMPSPAEYWNDFKIGFLVGMGMELLAIPLLAPIARKLAAKASTMLEAAQILREEGKGFADIARTLLGGAERMEAALGRTLPQAEIIEPLARGFREKMMALLRTYAREYETRSYRALVTLVERDLSAAASRGLSRLLASSADRQIEDLIAGLARNRAPVVETLERLGALDRDAMAALARNGGVARLGDSPVLLRFLERHQRPGWRLLELHGHDVGALERLLARVHGAGGPLGDDLVDNFATIVLRKGNALPRDVVAEIVIANRGVSYRQLQLLDRLHGARVQLEDFARGNGPGLTDFERAWNAFSPRDQAYALDAQGRPHTETVLRRAEESRQRAATRARLAAEAQARGQPHVEGRYWAPATSTPTRYVWVHKDLGNLNYVNAELNDGVLRITLRSQGAKGVRREGHELLDDVFCHFGNVRIRRFEAQWLRDGDFATNYNQYMENLRAGMSPRDAAWNTWTGQQMRARGFATVEVPPHDGDAATVWAYFGR